MDFEQHIYGMTEEGEAVIVYILRAENGAEVHITNYGASIIKILVPDADGKLADVVLGYEDLPAMMRDTAYVGRTIGRTVGRIASAEVTIDGVEHLLDINSSPNHLNGGAAGFHNKMWDARFETNRVVMSHISDEGEGGYPGTLSVEAIFDFDDDMSLEITYLAKSDATTVVNISSNIFFNLSGEVGSTILDHELRVDADKVAEMDEYQTPSGEFLATEGTPMAFRDFKAIGADIRSEFNEMFYMRGYDHFFPKREYKRGILTSVAELRDPKSRRRVEVLTSQEGVNVYSGNHLKAGSPMQTKSAERFVAHEGVAITSRALRAVEIAAGELYCEKNVYKFSIY